MLSVTVIEKCLETVIYQTQITRGLILNCNFCQSEQKTDLSKYRLSIYVRDGQIQSLTSNTASRPIEATLVIVWNRV